MSDKMCFVWVEFPDDPNVAGMKYWYVCDFDGAEVGDRVIAPLGRHNNTQEGVIREVRITEDYNSPFPLYLIKGIKKLIKTSKEL
ncbi:MAG: hypothetical protein ACI4MH_02965 [Candidatus Coproplasma sp.]